MESEFDDLHLQHDASVGAVPAQPVDEVEGEEMYTEEDEDYEDDLSEEDERPTREDFRQYGMYPSLPTPSGPPDMEADCDNVEEYLRRVRYSFPADVLPYVSRPCCYNTTPDHSYLTLSQGMLPVEVTRLVSSAAA